MGEGGSEPDQAVYCSRMTRRNRLLAFGSSVALIVLGAIADDVFGGITGEAVAIALVSLGGIALVSLVFLEIGLSEDRERAREQAAARERDEPPARIRRRPPLRRRR
jgi:hypothetical protein